MDYTRRRVSGGEILSHFVTEYGERIDAVVVFAPYRKNGLMGQSELKWSVSVFNRPGLQVDGAGLDRIVAALPAPRFEGYQVRSLFRQRVFAPSARGRYLGWHIEDGRNGKMKVKVSSRALLDLLAGRITVAQFRHVLGERDGEKGVVHHCLNNGMTLQGVEIESAGLDKDDDYLVLNFADDPAARELRLPPQADPDRQVTLDSVP